MKIGDKDGLGVIYDNFGEFITEPKEQIISSGNVSFGIISGWKEGGSHGFNTEDSLININRLSLFI